MKRIRYRKGQIIRILKEYQAGVLTSDLRTTGSATPKELLGKNF